MGQNYPTALIVIPTLNEEAHIAEVIRDLECENHNCPIVVMDGGSTDRTCRIVQELARGNPKLSLVNNPERTQAHAVNLAALLAQSVGLSVDGMVLSQINPKGMRKYGFGEDYGTYANSGYYDN
jgi:glycosyltransferase involved in cell wall biosynthesis